MFSHPQAGSPQSQLEAQWDTKSIVLFPPAVALLAYEAHAMAASMAILLSFIASKSPEFPYWVLQGNHFSCWATVGRRGDKPLAA